MANPRRPLAFRVRAATAERLRRRSRETGGPTGRRPALVGSRLDVWQVIDTVRQNGNSIERAADYLGTPVERVRACVRYYADYEDEIDEWTLRARELAEREEARWRRERELFA